MVDLIINVTPVGFLQGPGGRPKPIMVIFIVAPVNLGLVLIRVKSWLLGSYGVVAEGRL